MTYYLKLQEKKLVVGLKQVRKAIERDAVESLYLAQDADCELLRPIIDIAASRGIVITYVDTMRELGTACLLEVGSAACAVLK